MDPNNQPTQPLAPPPDQGVGAPSAPAQAAPSSAPAAPAPSADPLAPGSVSPVPADPTSPSAMMPPSMADPAASAAPHQGGNKKALGFMFVIGGVLALIVLVVLALQVL